MNKLFLFSLHLRNLILDNICQQLVLKTLGGHCEIYHTELYKNLRVEDWICHLCEHKYLQVLVNLHPVLAQLGIASVVHHVVLLRQQIVQSRVNEGVRHFQDNRAFHPQNRLESLQQVITTNLHHDGSIPFLHIFDPFAGLKLRVNHHRILHSFVDHDGIVDGELVFGKTMVDPVCNLKIISEYIFELEFFMCFDVHTLYFLNHFFIENFSVFS